MKPSRFLAAVALLAACAWGQDERRVVSPGGQLELRIFVSQSERGGLSRLAYRIFRGGKPLVETSYLGLNIHNQEPFLGENDGLIGSHTSDAPGSRYLIANYMQNGSIGRLIDVEARVWNNGVAFRYIIPRSSALEEILIDDELTEFDVAPGMQNSVRIGEVARPPYPPVTFARRADGINTTRLLRPYPDAVTAFEGKTPLVCPWRVIALDDAALAAIATELRAAR